MCAGEEDYDIVRFHLNDIDSQIAAKDAKLDKVRLFVNGLVTCSADLLQINPLSFCTSQPAHDMITHGVRALNPDRCWVHFQRCSLAVGSTSMPGGGRHWM